VRQTDGLLRVVQNDQSIAVRVRRCFPWSEPVRFLSLRDADDDEVAFVADPAALDDDSRRALEDVLVEAGFVFELLEVFAIEEEVELRDWRVMTAQGPRSFQTRLDDWPRELPETSTASHIRSVCPVAAAPSSGHSSTDRRGRARSQRVLPLSHFVSQVAMFCANHARIASPVGFHTTSI
jgi:hypothetical protein